MGKTLLTLAGCLLVLSVILIGCVSEPGASTGPLIVSRNTQSATMATDTPSVTEKKGPDHSSFPALNADFATGSDVTRACITCHSDEADDFMKTVHWTWEGPAPNMANKPANMDIGKMTTINNFCVAVESNEARCTQCHAGYGWKDKNFDFTSAENIDCLVCHDNSGQYAKDLKTAGNPAEGVDLKLAAGSVGKSTRENCGSCHFFAGGGDNVKKGDLGSALINPTADADVHMGKLGFQCADCHSGADHEIRGESLHTSISVNPITCAGCHEGEVHGDANLDKHTQSISCETCHIPAFSRQQPTKVFWDWSTAGKKDADGKPYAEKDENGWPKYDSKKGNFVMEMNVEPTLAWWDGSLDRMLLGDAYSELPVSISSPIGDISNPAAKIHPFKVMKGVQGADSDNEVLLVPHLFGKVGGPTPYWGAWKWDKAFEEGMAYAGLPYSGEFEWVETEMYMSINHEVAPADQARSCMDCHNGGIDFKALGYSGDPMSAGGR